MLDQVHDECGIAAVYRLDSAINSEEELYEGSVTRLVPDMLIDLQNRGQPS